MKTETDRPSQPKTGYIFGAGASFSAGYPLAKAVIPAITEFIPRLEQLRSCQNLRAWCLATLKLMTQHNCETVDELAFVLRESGGGQAVLQAKAVISALFFDLESRADLANYRRAVRAMIDFTQLSLPLDGRITVPSRGFCITYNYDRCLERAIYDEVLAAGRSPSHGYTTGDVEVRVKRLLNSGLNTMRERLEPIDTSRFAVLKMHGTIGTLWEDRYLAGEPLYDFGRVQVSDQMLAAFQRDHRRASPSMILFPWEANDAHDTMKRLIEETDRAARLMLADVEELKIVGYSFHAFNQGRLEALLSHARNCKIIDLYDPGEEPYLQLQSLSSRLALGAKVLFHRSSWNP